jgi:hypothetical protein
VAAQLSRSGQSPFVEEQQLEADHQYRRRRRGPVEAIHQRRHGVVKARVRVALGQKPQMRPGQRQANAPTLTSSNPHCARPRFHPEITEMLVKPRAPGQRQRIARLYDGAHPP